MVLLRSRILRCNSTRVAELHAVEWASKIIDTNEWSNVEWSSDEAIIIEDINAEFVIDA